MCFQALPAILSAVGTGVQAVNQNRALRDQDQAAARGLREQIANRDAANKRVSDQVRELSESNPEDEVAQAESDFTAALKRAKVARGGSDLEGAGGGRFQDDLGLARTQAETEGKTLAQQLARIDAPNFQRIGEGSRISDTVSDLATLDDRSRAIEFLTRMRVAGRAANPGVNALGQGLTAFGLAQAGAARKPRLGRSPAEMGIAPVTDADFTGLFAAPGLGSALGG